MLFRSNPCLQKGELFVSFEEMIYIHEDTRHLMGRDHWDEVGTL